MEGMAENCGKLLCALDSVISADEGSTINYHAIKVDDNCLLAEQSAVVEICISCV